MQKQRKALVNSILKHWDSCVTHLDYCVQRNAKGKDSRLFHVDTVIEYLEAMLEEAKALR